MSRFSLLRGSGQTTNPAVTDTPSRVSILKSTPITPVMRPTDVVSTITNKPLTEYDSMGRTPSFSAMVKAGIVDDPTTKARIFMADLYPELPENERMKLIEVRDGEFVFLDRDDKVRRIMPDLPSEKLRSFAANSISHSPEIVMGTAGAILGGVPGAGLGAAGGAGIRKVVGSLAFNEPQTTFENIKLMALAGGAAIAGEKFLGGGAVRSSKHLLTKRMIRETIPDPQLISKQQTGKLTQMARGHGIDLMTPQATGNQDLIGLFNLLGDLPASSNIIKGARQGQGKQVQDALQNFITDLAPSYSGKFRTSRDLVEAAAGAMKQADKFRARHAAGFYNDAFAKNPKVNIKPVINLIDAKLQTAKGGIRDELLRAKKLLQAPDLPKKTTHKILDKSGKPYPAKIDYDTSLVGLHQTKMNIDDIISSAKDTGLGNTAKRNYVEIQEALLSQMDKSSVNYKAARKTFSDFSKLKDAVDDTILSGIGRLDGPQVTTAVKKLLAAENVTPEVVSRAKRMIARQNPDIWDKAIRTHVQDVFERIKVSAAGGPGNVAGQFRKQLFGNERQRQILEAAMNPKAYKDLSNFMEVLERVSLTSGRESTTAPRQIALERLKRASTAEVITTLVTPLRTPERLLADRFNAINFDKNARALAQALVDGTYSDILSKLVVISPKSEKFIRGAGTFFTLLGKAQAQKD